MRPSPSGAPARCSVAAGLLAACSLSLAAPHPAAADDLEPVADPAERLERWFSVQRGAMDGVRLFAGPLSIGAGAGVLGVGIAAAADVQYATHPNLAWLQIGVGVMGIAQGAVWLLITSEPQARWDRWRAAREQGLDEAEQARFEGELRSYRRIAEMERALYRWSGLGLIFGGGVILGATPGAELPEAHEVASYVSGGVYAGVGLVLLVASFIPTLGEDGWRRYERGEAPRLSLRPAGAGLAGTFDL